MRPLAPILAALVLATSVAPPVSAQSEGMTLAQVQRKYRTMNEVHILKCDYDGNRIFGRTEMICVQNIYRSLYLDRN
jgi:hypothetical protein